MVLSLACTGYSGDRGIRKAAHGLESLNCVLTREGHLRPRKQQEERRGRMELEISRKRGTAEGMVRDVLGEVDRGMILHLAVWERCCF